MSAVLITWNRENYQHTSLYLTGLANLDKKMGTLGEQGKIIASHTQKDIKNLQSDLRRYNYISIYSPFLTLKPFCSQNFKQDFSEMTISNMVNIPTKEDGFKYGLSEIDMAIYWAQAYQSKTSQKISIRSSVFSRPIREIHRHAFLFNPLWNNCAGFTYKVLKYGGFDKYIPCKKNYFMVPASLHIFADLASKKIFFTNKKHENNNGKISPLKLPKLSQNQQRQRQAKNTVDRAYRWLSR